MPVHPQAAAGFSAGAAAYDRGRPEYPPALDQWLADDLGLRAGRSALDLGVGTGKFTPRLLAAGAAVSAVEPVPAMLARLMRRRMPVDARAGTAESIPFADRAFDAVVCAQSFHWFANPAALAEIRRVLKPGGRLGLVWNVRDERVPWVAALARIIEPFEGDAPRYGAQHWRAVFPAPGFGPLAERDFPHQHRGVPEQVIVDRILSVSFIAALDPPARDRIAARLRGLIAATPELAAQSAVTFPYKTAAVACARI